MEQRRLLAYWGKLKGTLSRQLGQKHSLWIRYLQSLHFLTLCQKVYEFLLLLLFSQNIWQLIDDLERIQTDERFKRTLFIRTKTQPAIFRGNPLYQAIKRHLNNIQTVKNDEKWDGKLIHFVVVVVVVVGVGCFPVQCLEEYKLDYARPRDSLCICLILNYHIYNLNFIKGFKVQVLRFYWAFCAWGLESEVAFAHDIPYEQAHEFY